jgi:hypothetical protein
MSAGCCKSWRISVAVSKSTRKPKDFPYVVVTSAQEPQAEAMETKFLNSSQAVGEHSSCFDERSGLRVKVHGFTDSSTALMFRFTFGEQLDERRREQPGRGTD